MVTVREKNKSLVDSKLDVNKIDKLKELDEGADPFSFWRMIRGDFTTMIFQLITYVINMILSAIILIIEIIFEYLLYMDYFIGLFACLMGIFPFLKDNVIQWFISNFSLLAWILILELMQWIMNLFYLSQISSMGKPVFRVGFYPL